MGDKPHGSVSLKRLHHPEDIKALWLQYIRDLGACCEVLKNRSETDSLNILSEYFSCTRIEVFGIYAKDDILIGFTMFAPETKTYYAEIAEFFISPEYRKTGYGTQAALTLLSKTHRLYFEVLILNHRARKFWKLIRFLYDLEGKVRKTEDGIETTAYWYVRKEE